VSIHGQLEHGDPSKDIWPNPMTDHSVPETPQNPVVPASTLADRLRATGKPECAEYADAPRHEVLVWGQLAKVVPESVADACITRLLDENERLAMDRDGFRGAFNTCIERAEQAEADLANAIEARDKDNDWAVAECKAREQAEAERRLERDRRVLAEEHERVAEAEARKLRQQRDRWRYLAEKATWCFHEGMHLLGYYNPRCGSWFPYHVTDRWAAMHAPARLARHEAEHEEEVSA
jgi:hypothetical protein